MDRRCWMVECLDGWDGMGSGWMRWDEAKERKDGLKIALNA